MAVTLSRWWSTARGSVSSVRWRPDQVPAYHRYDEGFPVRDMTAANLAEGRDEFDAHDVLRHLVAESAFDVNAYRRPVGNWQLLVV